MIDAKAKVFLLCWLSLISISSTAFAWWNDEWTLRKKLTLDTTATGSAIADPIGTCAVLIRLHDGNFQFANAKDDGGDLRLVLCVVSLSSGQFYEIVRGENNVISIASRNR